MARFIALICAVITVIVQGAQAHESRPLYIELVEVQPDAFRLSAKVPDSVSEANSPIISMPPVCRVSSERSPMLLHGSALYSCRNGLSGGEIEITWAAYNPSISTLIRLRYSSGQEVVALLGPQETRWQVPGPETKVSVALQYTRLGSRHIWGGVDHILFLLCLIWIAGRWRRLLASVSGFTLAHSVTLVLSSLDLVHVPVLPTEAVISLSIIFLARELVDPDQETLTWRAPILVSSVFGLIHGLGFAAVLGEIGLPQIELLTGLLFFNFGVEIGQLVLILAIVLLFQALRRVFEGDKWMSSTRTRLRTITSYSIGMLAASWFAARVAMF